MVWDQAQIRNMVHDEKRPFIENSVYAYIQDLRALSAPEAEKMRHLFQEVFWDEYLTPEQALKAPPDVIYELLQSMSVIKSTGLSTKYNLAFFKKLKKLALNDECNAILCDALRDVMLSEYNPDPKDNDQKIAQVLLVKFEEEKALIKKRKEEGDKAIEQARIAAQQREDEDKISDEKFQAKQERHHKKQENHEKKPPQPEVVSTAPAPDVHIQTQPIEIEMLEFKPGRPVFKEPLNFIVEKLLKDLVGPVVLREENWPAFSWDLSRSILTIMPFKSNDKDPRNVLIHKDNAAVFAALKEEAILFLKLQSRIEGIPVVPKDKCIVLTCIIEKFYVDCLKLKSQQVARAEPVIDVKMPDLRNAFALNSRDWTVLKNQKLSKKAFFSRVMKDNNITDLFNQEQRKQLRATFLEGFHFAVLPGHSMAARNQEAWIDLIYEFADLIYSPHKNETKETMTNLYKNQQNQKKENGKQVAASSTMVFDL